MSAAAMTMGASIGRGWLPYRICARCQGWLYVYERSVKHGVEWACLNCGARRYESLAHYEIARRMMREPA